jgi:hypothetical protein
MRNGQYKYDDVICWFVNDKLHRDSDLQAYEDASGYRAWWQHDKYHRTTWPARMWGDGRKEWWINGEKLDCTTQAEFEKLMRLKAFW